MIALQNEYNRCPGQKNSRRDSIGMGERFQSRKPSFCEKILSPKSVDISVDSLSSERE